MNFVNGVTYYAIDDTEKRALAADAEVGSLAELFTTPVEINGTTYWIAPSITDPFDFISQISDDPTPPNVILDYAVYYSAHGFQLINPQ